MEVEKKEDNKDEFTSFQSKKDKKNLKRKLSDAVI